MTIVAPLTTWSFTFVAGTGHIVYPLLPVIYETAHQSGIRPERPMAVATIASQQAITASPVAAATAAMIGLFAEKGITQWGLPQILMICVPATLTGVLAAAIVSMFVGKDLKDDPEYQARLAAGKIPGAQSGRRAASARADGEGSPRCSSSPASRWSWCSDSSRACARCQAQRSALAMPIVIEIVMLSVAAIMLLATKVAVDTIPKTPTLRAGVVAVIGIFGLAWLGDSFIAAHKDVIVPAIGHWAEVAPWTFAFGLFFASVLLYSQAATTRALMPLGIALGIPPQFLIAMFPVGQRLLLHPDVRLADRGDQLRPVGHDEDRQVRAQSLVHDPGHRGDRGGGGHWTFPRPRDVRSDGRMNDASRWSRSLRGVTVAMAALATAGMAAAQGIYPGDLPKEGYKLPGGIEPVLQLRDVLLRPGEHERQPEYRVGAGRVDRRADPLVG